MSSVYSNPIEELITRLAYHTQAGNRLAGYFWFDKPTEHTEGRNDFPSIQLYLPDITEEYRPRTTGIGTLVAKLTVETAREKGIPDWIDAVADVMNAIEYDTLGDLDPSLGGTITKPFEFAVVNNYVTDLSLVAEVVLTLAPRMFDRGKR